MNYWLGGAVDVEDLRQKAKEFIANPDRNPNLPSVPNKAIVLSEAEPTSRYHLLIGIIYYFLPINAVIFR